MTSAHKNSDTRIFQKECISLSKAGFDTYLVAPGESAERGGVHIVGAGQPPASRLQRMTKMARTVYKKACSLDADVYHFHDPELLPYGKKLKKKGKIVIYDRHEDYPQQIRHKPYLPTWCRRMVADCFAHYENSMVKQFDAVVFPCTIQGKTPLIDVAKRVELIDNFPILSCNEGNTENNSPRSAVCYTGSLSRARGIEEAIRACDKAGVPLLLAGSVSKDYQAELQSMPEYRTVTYLGVLSGKEVGEVLDRCFAGLSLLRNEGQYWTADNLSTKIYEYWVHNLPVICSDYPFAHKVITEAKAGVCVDPEDIDTVATAISTLEKDREAARKMGENGHRIVCSHYHWGTQAEKLVNMYHDLLSGGSTATTDI